MKNGNTECEEEEKRKKNEEEEEFWQRAGDGLKRALAFPLEKVLMPYWMQLLRNRCAVCGHQDPGFTSCMATHPMEVHPSRVELGSHQPPPPSTGLR